jgi:signal transduction histidine kinase
MVAGLLLTAFFYHLTMFLLYRGRRTSLYFALCCLVFAIRAIVSLIIGSWPDYDWQLLVRVDYVLMFSGAALLMLFFQGLFPELLSRRVLWTVAAALALYDVVVVVAGPLLSSHLLTVVQPLCILAVGYIALRLGLSLRKGTLRVVLAFAGIAQFLATALNDVLYLNNLPSLGMELMPMGIAVLMLAYMIILTVDFAQNERRLEAAGIRERTMLAEKTALERQSRMKTEFLQDISHDLKTPLTVVSTEVLNTADQLDFEMDADDMRRSLGNAQREIMRMSRMVDEAMRFSSAQEDRSRLEPLDMVKLLRSVESFRSVLAQRGNVLVLDVADHLATVRGDADMLSQVMLNLLSNANRHTQDGRIDVVAAQLADAVSVTVRDTGEGVGPELLAEMFTRGVSQGGTGLGLSICKSIVKAHAGEITAASPPGGGLAVTFVLPIYDEGGA